MTRAAESTARPRPLGDQELLALHRELVALPSVSGSEEDIADFALGFLWGRGVEARRVGSNVIAIAGDGPTLCFNTHLDTVPPTQAWTKPPHEPVVQDGKVYGLGSNDAKAAAAAMIAAFLRLAAEPAGIRVVLTLASQEETNGKGTEAILEALAESAVQVDAAIVGEPTGLDIAIAQKGLLVLEVVAEGKSCHAAHAKALGVRNPVFGLARDLAAIEDFDAGPEHPQLGPVTIEPTVLRGASARNMVAAEAGCILDVRTNPEPPVDEIIDRLRARMSTELRVLSRRLRPCEISGEHPLVRAAAKASPTGQLIGSRGVSDWVAFQGVPALKAGPGKTERSHTADEWVLESEVLDGARFYEETAREWARLVSGEGP